MIPPNINFISLLRKEKVEPLRLLSGDQLWDLLEDGFEPLVHPHNNFKAEVQIFNTEIANMYTTNIGDQIVTELC